MLYEGNAVDKDINESWRFLYKAAELGDSEAAYLLATINWSDDLTLPREIKQNLLITAGNNGFEDAKKICIQNQNDWSWDEIGFKGAWNLQYAYVATLANIGDKNRKAIKENQKNGLIK